MPQERSQSEKASKEPGRMVKKAVQRGRNEQKAEAYSLRYVEALRDVRTKLAAFFNILLIHLAMDILTD